MSAWDPSTLDGIAGSSELTIAPLRADGETYREPTIIWFVVVDGELFARAFTGAKSHWFRAAMRQGRGQITVAGTTYDVEFAQGDPALAERIDEAYLAKYGRSRYSEPMLGPGAVETTALITPAA